MKKKECTHEKNFPARESKSTFARNTKRGRERERKQKRIIEKIDSIIL